MAEISRHDRIAGCLFGGALGDAIGAPFEGGDPANAAFALPAELRVTDDTQLTIATCEAILQESSVVPEAIARRFVRWFRERRVRGVGASTLKSLVELDAGGHWATSGATGERSAGNGAAMRIAPLAFLLDPDVPQERQTIRDVCRITHRNEEAYVGALAMVRSVRYVAHDRPLDDALLPILVDSLPDSRVRDRLIEIHDTSLSIEEYADRFDTSGYVVDSVPAAILAALRAANPVGMIGEIVACGGDTDTIASMAGQLFGAAHGLRALPTDTLNEIDEAPLLRETAAAFSRLSLDR